MSGEYLEPRIVAIHRLISISRRSGSCQGLATKPKRGKIFSDIVVGSVNTFFFLECSRSLFNQLALLFNKDILENCVIAKQPRLKGHLEALAARFGLATESRIFRVRRNPQCPP